MLVKELYIKHPITKEIEALKNVEAEDATEFKGFIRVKLLDFTEVPGKDSVFFFWVLCCGKLWYKSTDGPLQLHRRKIFRVFFYF